MAALVVQSRFAGLKIEDDDHSGNENQKSKKNKANPPKKVESAKKTKTSNNKPQVNKKRSQTGFEFSSKMLLYFIFVILSSWHNDSTLGLVRG